MATQTTGTTKPNAEDIQSLKKDISALTNDVNNIMKTVKQSAESSVSRTVSKLSGKMNGAMKTAGEKSRDYYDMARDNVHEITDKAEKQIQKQPFKYTGLAIAAGAIIGLLLAKRR